MNRLKKFALALVALAGFVASGPSVAQSTLLNVSYDVTREFYRDYNLMFSQYWKQKSGTDITINQSHGGAGAQARAVADGLSADVVTLNQPSDIDMLVDRGLVNAGWHQKYPNGASPTYSTVVFVVRKGNPKRIRDWDDLTRGDVSVVLANPKTSGIGRYGYLGAWGYARKTGQSDSSAAQFVGKLLANVAVFDTGSRGATTSFAQRGMGDVLIAFESEALQIDQNFDAGKVDLVYPSMSIESDNPVAVVDRVVDRRQSRALAEAYLGYLYTDAAQDLAAKHFMRVRNQAVATRYGSTFKPLTLFTVEDAFGGWREVQRVHFADGGKLDQMTATNAKH